MPPHLHPRSAATSTLFAGTLLASFIVVGIPHIFPCPRPRNSHADEARVQLGENGEPSIRLAHQAPQRQRQPSTPRPPQTTAESASIHVQDEAALFRQLKEEANLLDKQARACPVPKPTGWIGRAMGFEQTPSTAKNRPGPSTTEQR